MVPITDIAEWLILNGVPGEAAGLHRPVGY